VAQKEFTYWEQMGKRIYWNAKENNAGTEMGNTDSRHRLQVVKNRVDKRRHASV
jgi:hypothetical protein